MTACEHIRQVPDLGGSDGYVETWFDGALPCADPTCPASIVGEDMHVERLHGHRGPRSVKVFKRVAGPDGWRWVRQP